MTDLAQLTRELVDLAWRRGLAPEPQLTVSEWADRNRVLPGTNAEPGPWRTDRVPYLREIMDSLSVSSPCERVVMMKGAQTGGTEAGLNAIGYWIAHAPGLILAVWPSINMVRRNSRTRIEPLIEGSPALRNRVGRARSKDPGNTVDMKEFAGGALVMTGANSAIGLRSTAARYLVLDEVDGFPTDADDEGDPVDLAIQRTVTFEGRSKILMISTPTIAGVSRIEKAYLESDQRKFFVPCPHCGTCQVLTWAGVKWDDDPRKAYYACSTCGGVIEERDKPEMLAAGEWRPTAEGDGATRGYHLPAFYSPFESWGKIAAAFKVSHRDPVRLKSWTNLKEGMPFEDRDGAALEPELLLSRLENFDDQLPDGVVALSAGVDVQGDRVELETVGWGAGEESWSIAYETLWGNPAEPAVWLALDRELLRKFHHPRAGAMGIRAVCIDSGGHHTQNVYRWTKERAGRRVWAIKGRGGPGVPVWPRRPPKAREKAFVPFIIGVDAAKEIITARLRFPTPGPGYCHFPLGRDLDYFRQLGAEKIIKTYRRGVLIREWKKDPGVRNEALDCRVYAYAALHGLVAQGLRLADEARKLVDLPIIPKGAEPKPAPAPTIIRSNWLSR